MDDFVEAVLDVVERIRRGRVRSYGSIAEELGRGGPRQVGQVMSFYGHGVPWWRVVRADGRLAPHLMVDAQEHWLAEGTPVRNGRVLMAEAFDDPDEQLDDS